MELYLSVIREELIKNGIKVILTTHSPSTVAEIKPEELCEIINDDDGQRIEWAKNEDGKKRILQKLAPKFVYDDELGFIGLAKGREKVIVFTEGTTDQKIFKEYADRKGFKDYKFIECTGAGNINFAAKAFTVIPYFRDLLNEKIIVCLFDLDQEGIGCLNTCINDKTGSKVNNFLNKKEPIIIPHPSSEYRNIYFTSLVPPTDSPAWNNYANNNPYEYQNLKKEGDLGLKRQFDLIAKIKSQGTSKSE